MALTQNKPRSSVAEHLDDIVQRIRYKSTIGYIPETQGVDINVFNQGSLQEMYYLDTTHCATKRKTYNRKCLYDTFGEYANMTSDQVKSRVINEIKTNPDWYCTAGTCPLGMRGLKFEQWLAKLERPRTWPDELCLYALCMIFRRHALVFTGSQPWCTVEVSACMTLGIVQEMCETILLYLGNYLFATLK